MANYYFKASEYAVGTNIRQLGFEDNGASAMSASVQAGDNNRNVFTRADGDSADLFAWLPQIDATTTQFEILLITQTYPDPGTYDGCAPQAFGYVTSAVKESMLAVEDLSALSRLTEWDSTGAHSSTSFSPDVPRDEANTPLYAMRVSVNGDQVSYKAWIITSTSDLTSEEPASMIDTLTYSYAQSGHPGVGFRTPNDARYELISIGTGGDPAPITRNEASTEVQTPSNLSVSNLTVDSATLNWE